MQKSEAKRLVQEGKAQIHNDAPDKLELLRDIADSCGNGLFEYYRNDQNDDKPFQNLQIINLSEIEEDVVQWQYSNDGINWYDVGGQCRIKPAVDLKPEIDALTAKAKEAGMDIVITFEKK